MLCLLIDDLSYSGAPKDKDKDILLNSRITLIYKQEIPTSKYNLMNSSYF